MSELRSVLDQLSGMDPDLLSVEELAAEISEALRGQQMLDVLIARWTKLLADQDGYFDLGYPSPTSFLIHQGRMSPGHAKQVVARARSSERAPAAFAAWADGRLSTDQAAHLFSAAEAVPDEFPDAEEALVGIVEGLDAVDTAKTVTYWRQAMEGPGDLDAQTQQDRRGLSISKTTGDMRRVDGWLTAMAGEALETAIDAMSPPLREGDTRSPRQRRHDALEDLCRDWLDNGTTPTIGGEKPHIVLHADLPALKGIAGGLHETENGDIVDIDTLRTIACDSSLTRVVLGGDSQVLDVGRKTRLWSPAQRRAIIARDRHCQGPGCRAKPRHCDIHHEDHWIDGGRTAVDKGKLLCRPCHIQEHLKERHRRT